MTPDESAIADAAQALIDVATRTHHDRQADESFTECLICGEWDGHAERCPIPLIYQWLED